MINTDLTGHWSGTIVLGKEYKQDAGKRTYFDLELVQHEQQVAGTAVDSGGDGGQNPDPAHILGSFRKDKLNFIKQYSSFHYANSKGEIIINKSRKGPKIHYSGIYDPQQQSFSGKWKLSEFYLVLFIIPFRVSCSGTWHMSRKTKEEMQ